MTERIAFIDGLPVYGPRITIENAEINEVITYKVKGQWIFSVVTGTTPTMIKVRDLICENTEQGINLYISYGQNPITKGLLKPSRRIFKVSNLVI